MNSLFLTWIKEDMTLEISGTGNDGAEVEIPEYQREENSESETEVDDKREEKKSKESVPKGNYSGTVPADLWEKLKK